MGKVKKEGFLKKFMKWLDTPDEPEVVDGVINIKAFKGEDPNVLAVLNARAQTIDKQGTTMFTDKAKKRAETVKGMKAQVETPTMQRKETNNNRADREIE